MLLQFWFIQNFHNSVIFNSLFYFGWLLYFRGKEGPQQVPDLLRETLNISLCCLTAVAVAISRVTWMLNYEPDDKDANFESSDKDVGFEPIDKDDES